MSFEGLQERLTVLQETTAQLRKLIDRLATIDSPEEDEHGQEDDSGSNSAEELATEINQVLREQEEDLELLQEEITDLRSGRPGSEAEHRKTRLREWASRLEGELKDCRVSFRKAQLLARRNAEQRSRRERELLLTSLAASAATASAAASERGASSGATSPTSTTHSPPQRIVLTALPPRRRRHVAPAAAARASDPVVAASADVTASLRRMHDAMSAELARSGFAREALEESTATLRDLAGRYDALDGLLAGSRELLGTLLRSQKSDTWYLETAFYVLAATLAWLVFRRWIYGPAWWLVWLPFRTLWRFTAAGVGGSVDAVGGRGAGGKLDGSSITSGGSAVTASMQAHGAPTIQARAQATAAEATADGDSMVEKVGKIVDGAADTYGATEDGSQENTGGDQPNPKKRMWEEPIEEAKQMERESETEREKDEL